MKKYLSLLLVILMVTTLAVGCRPNPDGVSSEAKDTLVIGIEEDITGLDPFAQNTSLQNTFTILMYDTLLKINPATGEIVASLAESYEVVSATEYVFHLREGIKFHDGTVMKASDVKFSLERVAKSAGMASKVSQIEKVEVEDDLTVRIFLNTPSTTILNNLAFCGTSIMSEEWCKANEGSFKNNGTGPYIFREWNSGDSIILDRNDKYWGEPGKMQTLKFVVKSEASTRTIALETGEIDINASPAAIDIKKLTENEKLYVVSAPSTDVQYWSLNTQLEPTNNLKVRQAIAHAINKEDILQVVLEGHGTPSTTMLVAGQQYSNPNTPGYEYNIEKAKQLMAEAGYEDGFDLRVCVRNDKNRTVAEIVQAQLLEININLKIDQMEGAAYTDLNMQGLMPATTASWQAATSDADNPLRNLLHSSSPGSSRDSQYKNPEFDAVLDEAVKETDPVKAKELYDKAQMIVYEDCPIIPLYATDWNIAANKHVKNIVIPACGDAMFYKDIYWE